MVGRYQATTLSAAASEVAARLGDATMTHWTQAELVVYLTEALRVWNAITATFRHTAVFSSVGTTVFYDLPTVVPVARGYTVTDRQMVVALQYALLEPPNGSTWNGTTQFSLSDLVAAISRRRDQFLLETGSVVTDLPLSVSPPPTGRVPLPESIIDVRRAAWISQPELLVSTLFRTDEWALTHYAGGWVQTPTRPPIAFSVGATPPLMLQLAPPPQDTGVLDLLAVVRGAVLNPSSVETPLGIPDDFAWVVKYGALSDLLSHDGLALDSGRAAYCESRWQQGLKLAQMAPVLLTARVNNIPVVVDAVANADAYSPLWQTVPGPVTQVLKAGGNLVGLFPPPGGLPGGGNWSITLDVVRNAPIPVNLGDFLQVGSEILDVLYDYAQHIALFKEGQGQLEGAMALWDRFASAGASAQAMDSGAVPDRVALLEQTLQGQRAMPPILPQDAATVLTTGEPR